MNREDRMIREREQLFQDMTREVIKLVDDAVQLGDWIDVLKASALRQKVRELVEQAQAIKGGPR